MAEDITVRAISGRKDLRAFIRFPWAVYKGDPNWVPPLISERLGRLDPKKNPFLSRAKVKLYGAYRRGRLVGTIAAFTNDVSEDHASDNIGGFGFFETLDDYGVASCLLDTAADTLRSWGMRGMSGPTNFTRQDEPGVLVDGEDCPPAMLEAHTPPYYRTLLEKYGMSKDRDMYAWRVHLPSLGPALEGLPSQLVRVFNAAADRHDVVVRNVRMDDWDREIEITRVLFNSTLSHLPEHVPVSLPEFRRYANQMRPLLDPEMALFAEFRGRPVGFAVAIPDFNRVLWRLNGRLLPFGWLRMWWYSRHIDVVSFKLMGVEKEFRGRGIDALLYLQVIRAAARRGYEWLDGSLTSENNPTVVRLAERLGAEQYKHYRIYKKTF